MRELAAASVQDEAPLGREALLTIGVALLSVVLLAVVVAVDPGTCIRDDMLSQHLSATREVWLAAKQGHLALVTPHSWFGGALAGEYQYGTLSLFAIAADALSWAPGFSLRATAFTMVALYVAVQAAGTFRLARVERCSPYAALFAAVVATFNGWTLRWAIAWYPTLASFAWLPWLLWALRRGGRTRPFFVVAFTHAIVAGGWPFTIGFGVVGAGIVILDEVVRTKTFRELIPLACAGALGLALSAPALLMLVAQGAASDRFSGSADYARQWTVPFHALPGLLLPMWRSMWIGFGSLTNRIAPELWMFVPLCLIGIMVLRARTTGGTLRRAAPWLALLGVATFLSTVPIHAPLRWSFRWLPLAHFSAGLAGAIAIDSMQRRKPGPQGEGSSSSRAFALVPSIAAFAGVLWVLKVVPAVDLPTWPVDDRLSDPAPLDPARTYLGLYGPPPPNEGTDLRFGLIPLLAGLTFVNGYSAMSPTVVSGTFPFETHGWPDPFFRRLLLDRITNTPAWLDSFGIDGLLLSSSVAEKLDPVLGANGWVRAGELPSGRVWHREGGPAPRAWLVDQAATGEGRDVRLDGPKVMVNESDETVSVEVKGALDRPAIMVFKRPAYPGYHATINGHPATTKVYRSVLVAVPIPEGMEGTVVLTYEPRSFVRGMIIAGIAMGISLLWFVASWGRRRYPRGAVQ